MNKPKAILALVLGAVFLFSGCAENNAKELHNWLMSYRETGSSIDYVVEIPDAIRISSPQIPEIDGAGGVLQPDGKVSLRLLGEVHVAGMTAREIAAKLTSLLQKYYEDPKVQVRVTGFNSKKIYASGVVGGASSGGSIGGTGAGDKELVSIPYTGRNTLLDTLVRIQPTWAAWRSQVQVIRSNPKPGERHKIYVNVDEMMASGDTSLNVLLEPNDMVIVPPTPQAWLGFRIWEFLWPIGTAVNGYAYPDQMYHTAKDAYSGD